MTLQQVLDFLAVAQHGSVHAAARATGQTQPALTKSLRRLEAGLGAPLFVRHAKGVQPTDYGRRFVEHAQRLASDAQRAREAMAQMVGERRGRVEYGISAAASILLAPAAVKRFRRAYPEVELRCRSGLYHTLAPALRDGRLDFVICPLPSDVPDPQFASRTLMHSRMVMCARRDHPLARARSLQALQRASFTVAAPPGLPGGGIYEVFERAGLGAPCVELHTDGLIDTIAFVAGSDCLALMPEALMRGGVAGEPSGTARRLSPTGRPDGLMSERLVVLPIADALPAYDVVLFQRRAVPLTPAAEELATEFEREAQYQRRE